MKHKLGKPQYKRMDNVSFDLTLNDRGTIKCFGQIYIVDAYGTWEQHEEPSYDIMVEDWLGSDEQCLVKHIRESQLTLLDNCE